MGIDNDIQLENSIGRVKCDSLKHKLYMNTFNTLHYLGDHMFTMSLFSVWVIFTLWL